jgi:hypothetical protein
MKPEHKVVYALQTSLDRAIDQYKIKLEANEKLLEDPKKWESFVTTERHKIKAVAQVQQGLANYRSRISKISVEDREDEEHDSQRLGDHMRAEGIAKPNVNWDAHAMISGSDTRAWLLRSLLAECEVGIDDAHNGCWLPTRTKHTGQPPYPEAVPHSRIHRHNYYAWLNIRFAGVRTKKIMVGRLRQTRSDLLYSSFPPEVMLPKGEWKEPNDNIPPVK